MKADGLPGGTRARTQDVPLGRFEIVGMASFSYRVGGANSALSRFIFEEARATAPQNVAYCLFRDGLDFLHLFINTAEDDSAAITELASFKTFPDGISGRSEAPPDVTRLSLSLVESYGLPK